MTSEIMTLSIAAAAQLAWTSASSSSAIPEFNSAKLMRYTCRVPKAYPCLANEIHIQSPKKAYPCLPITTWLAAFSPLPSQF